jgi:hypothetical protein
MQRNCTEFATIAVTAKMKRHTPQQGISASREGSCHISVDLNILTRQSLARVKEEQCIFRLKDVKQTAHTVTLGGTKVLWCLKRRRFSFGDEFCMRTILK